jgi:hypothetical protein
MAVLNALVFPGNSGDRAYISAMANNWRTNNGTPWFFGCFVYLDSLAPGENGWVVDSRRASNNATASGLQFLDSNNRWRGMYNASSIGQVGTSPAATTWYFLTMSNTGASLANVIKFFNQSGTQLDSITTSDTTSSSDDSNTQQVTLGARYDGVNTGDELRGRICLPVFIWGGIPSQADQEDFAADPLNTLDLWVATYGAANVVAFDDTWTDQGSNGETYTLTGGVTLGSGNGPTVTDRAAPDDAPTITTVGAFNIIYDLEQRVPVTGLDFGNGGAAPLVQLTSDPLGITGLVTQTDVNTWDDDSLVFSCALGGLTAGPIYIKVTNQTVGDPSYGQHGMKLITVKADTGAGVVAVRRTVPSINYVISVPIATFATADEFYERNAQEALTYSVQSGSLPTGVSLDSGTGVASGTVDSGAAAGSPYAAVIRAMDQNGAFVDQVLNWIISTLVATERAVGSWGLRGRRP